jgi:hypothetical protein
MFDHLPQSEEGLLGCCRSLPKIGLETVDRLREHLGDLAPGCDAIVVAAPALLNLSLTTRGARRPLDGIARISRLGPVGG